MAPDFKRRRVRGFPGPYASLSVSFGFTRAVEARMSEMQPTRPTPGYRYGGFWWRVLALFVDLIVICLAVFVLAVIVAIVAPLVPAFTGMDENTGAVIFLIAAWLYFALQESSSRRATLGKRACGLVVTDKAGER